MIRQNKESEEYSQSLLDSIREKDSQFDILTRQLNQLRETLGSRKFIFPKTLGKIKSDLDSILSPDDNEIEQGD